MLLFGIEKYKGYKIDRKELMGKIRNIPHMERPYEKMLMYGEKTLTDVELLSIIIKTGTKEESSLEIAENLMNLSTIKNGSLRFLQTISIEELQTINGIGKVKAIELKAIGEITKRISKPISSKEIRITSKVDVANLFMQELQTEENEVLKVLMLNNQNILKRVLTIAVGNENNIIVNVKAILSEPVKMQIPKIILVHNHPSGNPNPSNIDIEFTEKLRKAATLLDIQVLDHIIIGDGTYCSVLN